MYLFGKTALTHAGEQLAELFFPVACALCGKRIGSALCEECAESVPVIISRENGIVSGFAYQDEKIRAVIHKLKFGGYQPLGVRLGELLADILTEHLFEEDGLVAHETIAVLPIPLSRKRHRTRGFNQSEKIAQGLIKRSPESYTVFKDVLYKVKDTESQVSVKDRSTRLSNLKDSFAIYNSELIHGKTVLILDDVSTTGATLHEAEKAVRHAQPAKILLVSFAH